MSDGVTEVASWPAGPATGLDYNAALRRVMGLADFERSSHSPGHAVFHLQRMSLLMERMGSPELDVPAVHIAGTKGKGSTAAMVTSALAAEGYKAGLYTSPHLHSVVERIRVGLDPVRRREFSTLVEQDLARGGVDLPERRLRRCDHVRDAHGHGLPSLQTGRRRLPGH